MALPNTDVALSLLPFAGIAFLWLVSVLRDRMGAREDKFFATVILGSGILFLAMVLASAALEGVFMITACTLALRIGT